MKRLLSSCMMLLLMVTLSAKERIEGPFLILSTPYDADGAVDYPSLVREARFAASWNTPGIIWPQSNDAIDLLSREERFKGMEALVREWAAHPVKTVLTLGVSGDDTEDMLAYAIEAERLAAEYEVDVALCARPPYYGGATEQKEYFEALAGIARRPVIIQTYVNEHIPPLSVEFLIDLARRHPDVYGWIKEESNNLETNERQRQELAASDVIKTVFSAWGGWQWLYQRRQIGTCGLISERVAYAPITSCIWKMMMEGDRRGHLTEAYALYRLLIDQRFLSVSSLRGYQLHYLQRQGIIGTMVSRVSAGKKDGPDGTFSRQEKGLWKLHTESFSPEETAELDKCYDDMLRFVKKHDALVSVRHWFSLKPLTVNLSTSVKNGDLPYKSPGMERGGKDVRLRGTYLAPEQKDGILLPEWRLSGNNPAENCVFRTILFKKAKYHR